MRILLDVPAKAIVVPKSSQEVIQGGANSRESMVAPIQVLCELGMICGRSRDMAKMLSKTVEREFNPWSGYTMPGGSVPANFKTIGLQAPQPIQVLRIFAGLSHVASVARFAAK
jgi:hypothetical protein